MGPDEVRNVTQEGLVMENGDIEKTMKNIGFSMIFEGPRHGISAKIACFSVKITLGEQC